MPATRIGSGSLPPGESVAQAPTNASSAAMTASVSPIAARIWLCYPNVVPGTRGLGRSVCGNTPTMAGQRSSRDLLGAVGWLGLVLVFALVVLGLVALLSGG